MIDLDYFKHINDTYGHTIGDYVIRRTADELKRCLEKRILSADLGEMNSVYFIPERTVMKFFPKGTENL